MSKIDQSQDSIDHGVAYGEQRIKTAESQAKNYLLNCMFIIQGSRSLPLRGVTTCRPRDPSERNGRDENLFIARSLTVELARILAMKARKKQEHSPPVSSWGNGRHISKLPIFDFVDHNFFYRVSIFFKRDLS